MVKELISLFGPMKPIVSDNAGYLTATDLFELMKKNGIKLSVVLAHAPMSNVLAERMVHTFKAVLKKMVFG